MEQNRVNFRQMGLGELNEFAFQMLDASFAHEFSSVWADQMSMDGEWFAGSVSVNGLGARFLIRSDAVEIHWDTAVVELPIGA